MTTNALKPKVFTRRRFWTMPELALFKRLYPDRTAVEIADRLGRPLSALYSMATRLGLSKSQAFLNGPFSGRLDGIRGRSTRFQIFKHDDVDLKEVIRG